MGRRRDHPFCARVHLPIIGSGWVLALGTVFSDLSVALANEASKAEDATRASVAHSITVAYKPSHSGSPRRKTKTSVLSFPRSFGPHPNFFGTIRRYGRYPYWHCRRSMVMSQLSSPTPRRKSRYRGYDIKMERRDLCWMVTMKPSRPGLKKEHPRLRPGLRQSRLVWFYPLDASAPHWAISSISR